MKKNFNPFARKTPPAEYGAYFNLPYYFVERFDSHPNIYEIMGQVRAVSLSRVEKAGGERVFLHDGERLVKGKQVVAPMEVCYRLGGALVYFSRREGVLHRMEYSRDIGDDDDDEEEEDDGSELYWCKIFYSRPWDLNSVLGLIKREPERKRKGNVHLLCSMDGMLMLQRFDVKFPAGGVDMSLNYGEEASVKFERIVSALSEDRNGLILLSGDPGTGKSTFIKCLTKRTTRKVIYISSGAAEQITNPDFLTFVMRHRDCVLLLEDAEKVLRNREEQDNTAISNILNLTDGILGDCLNIMVVATFNIDRDKIDPALVRKGRLLVEHHFRPLESSAANLLLERMGSDRRVDKPTTLAELYNPEDNFHKDKEEKKKVGF